MQQQHQQQTGGYATSDDVVINDARKTNADVTTTSSIVDPFLLPSNHRRYPARPGLGTIIERQFRSV